MRSTKHSGGSWGRGVSLGHQGLLPMQWSNVCKPAGTREKGCSEGLACGPCSARRGGERTSSQLHGHRPGTEGQLLHFSTSPHLPPNLPTKSQATCCSSHLSSVRPGPGQEKSLNGPNAAWEEKQCRVSLSEDEEGRGMDGFCAQSWMSPCVAGPVSCWYFMEQRAARSAVSNLLLCQLQSQHCYEVICIHT